MTAEQIEFAAKLSRCTFLPGSYDKRFVRDMHAIAENKPEQELTEKQDAYLRTLMHRYRRQIGGQR